MKAVIYMDVPEWQIGKDVAVYFTDTMMQRGKCCELIQDRETVEGYTDIDGNPKCSSCGSINTYGCNYCDHCGKALKWNEKYYMKKPLKWNGLMEDRCVICGAIIPEGRQICPNCEAGQKPERYENKQKATIHEDGKHGFSCRSSKKNGRKKEQQTVLC